MFRAVFPFALLAGLAPAALVSAPALAVDTHWQVETGEWTDPANWSQGVPTPADDATINNGGTATFTGSGGLARYLGVGNLAGTSGHIVLGPSSVLSVNDITVGGNGSGDFLMEGGTLMVNWQFGVGGTGDPGNGSGSFTMHGGSVAVNAFMLVGRGSVGSFHQTAGSVDATNLEVGSTVQGPGGTYTISGGSLDVSQYFMVGPPVGSRLSIIGGAATFVRSGVFFRLWQDSILEMTIDATGVSPVEVADDVELNGIIRIIDAGAAEREYPIVTSGSGSLFTYQAFAVELPGPEWSWRATHDGVWVEKSPPVSTQAASWGRIKRSYSD